MHIIWENLVAMLIVMSIALLMVVLNERNQRVLTETTAYNSLKTHGVAFTQVLRRDMQGVVEVGTHGEEFPDSSFVFTARVGADTTLREIKYKRRKMGVLDLYVGEEDGEMLIEDRPYYEIQRFVREAGTNDPWQLSGGSAAALIAWEIQPLNENRVPLSTSADLSNARMIYVRFEMASPYLATRTVDRLRWETTFVPPQRSRTNVL